MPAVAPNTDIIFLKGIPLDSSYSHTVRFANEVAQSNAFLSWGTKFTMPANTYQRVKKYTLRVGLTADSLYDVNYMMFRNTSYGSKWFYAFVDKVEYINNNTSEVTYSLDVMQTFMFDYTVPPCFVEREHDLEDYIGSNLVPEDIGTGQLTMAYHWDDFYDYTELVYIIKYIPKKQIIKSAQYNDVRNGVDITIEILDDSTKAHYNYQVYDGYTCCYIPFTTTSNVPANNSQLKTVINHVVNYILSDNGNIIDIVKIPYEIYNMDLNDAYYFPLNSTVISRVMGEKFYDETHTADYTPKNKKLYTSPFCQLLVSNNIGQIATYEFERFGGNLENGLKRFNFSKQGVICPEPEVYLTPTSYRGFAQDFDNAMVLNGFPHASWNIDSITQWNARYGEKFVGSMIAGTISDILRGLEFGGQVATGVMEGIRGGDFSGMPSLANQLDSQQGVLNIHNWLDLGVAYKKPNQLASQASSSAVQVGQGRMGFRFMQMGVEYEVARMIDDYFTKYGYAIKRIKTPNIFNTDPNALPLRPYWNYLKTVDIVIKPNSNPNIPKGLGAQDMKLIASIYNNGITFWDSISHVGNYALDNSIVTP